MEDAMEYTKCWLEYRELSRCGHGKCLGVKTFHTSQIMDRIIEELKLGFHGLYGYEVEHLCLSKETETELLNQTECGPSIQLVLGTLNEENSREQVKEGYDITVDHGRTVINSETERGLLYGVFALLRELQVKQVIDYEAYIWKERKVPSNPLRMLNHWDNMDGTIERGYSGSSFFFEGNEIIINQRTIDYARMLASVGINGSVINNVNVKNAATYLVTPRYLSKLKELSEIFYSYGIQLFISINFAAPMELGKIPTADPCNEEVVLWWKETVDHVYREVPKMGGFLVKADSEGRPGPFTYGRTHGDGANMLARALKPYGGILIWRCFVYNCQQDWRDVKTDRAKAGYDHFMPLDGVFDDNVILQIKNGPMDFQVREPVSPLFGGLKSTNMMLEVQIAQEYTGQQRHVCYLLPWFQQILQFDTHCEAKPSTVASIVSGNTYQQKNCGMAAVANTGNDLNWTGHDLAASNLYGFGRLAFDTELSSEEIALEWIMQTLGNDDRVVTNVMRILMHSWNTYEQYTSPLGIGWMVTPHVHYGPDVDGYEYSRWGTYHKADHKGIGVDRSSKGTGFCRQYHEPLASMYNCLETCPEELLLFFHHIPYTHVLSSGKTVLQHIYDTHFEGAAMVEEFLSLWETLEKKIDQPVYERVGQRLKHQVQHSKEWRDVINSYFYRKTGIEDQYGRPLY